MEEIIKAAATQAPSLCVLAILVRWFLQHMRGRDEFLKDLHNQHMQARQDSRDALKDNAKAMREIVVATESLKHVIQSCSDRENRRYKGC